jgi:hypothetical protein
MLYCRHYIVRRRRYSPEANHAAFVSHCETPFYFLHSLSFRETKERVCPTIRKRVGTMSINHSVTGGVYGNSKTGSEQTSRGY